MSIIVKLQQYKIDRTTAQIDRAVKKMLTGLEEGIEKAGGYAHRKLNASLNGNERPLGQYRGNGVGGGGLQVLAGPLSGQINAQTGALRQQNKMVTEVVGIDPIKAITAHVGFIGLFAVKADLSALDPTVTVPIAKGKPNREEPLEVEKVPLRVYAARVILGTERMIGRNVLRLTAQHVEASDRLVRDARRGIKAGLAKVRAIK